MFKIVASYENQIYLEWVWCFHGFEFDVDIDNEIPYITPFPIQIKPLGQMPPT